MIADANRALISGTGVTSLTVTARTGMRIVFLGFVGSQDAGPSGTSIVDLGAQDVNFGSRTGGARGNIEFSTLEALYITDLATTPLIVSVSAGTFTGTLSALYVPIRAIQ